MSGSWPNCWTGSESGGACNEDGSEGKCWQVMVLVRVLVLVRGPARIGILVRILVQFRVRVPVGFHVQVLARKQALVRFLVRGPTGGGLT
jgi:hypothetical protein